jgi:hypothetical protein
VFSVDPKDAPIDWLDTDHVIYVYCRPMTIPRLYKGVATGWTAEGSEFESR